jgi:hypothetical protein
MNHSSSLNLLLIFTFFFLLAMIDPNHFVHDFEDEELQIVHLLKESPMLITISTDRRETFNELTRRRRRGRYPSQVQIICAWRRLSSGLPSKTFPTIPTSVSI